MSDLPQLPEKGKLLFVSRRALLALLAGIRRRTVKVAGGYVEVERNGQPVQLSLGLRAADDGRTIFLRENGGADTSSSSSESSSSSSSSGTDSSQPSDSPPSESSDSKTAIVWAGGRWIGWVCRESPEAKFDDVMEMAVGAPKEGQAVALATLPVEMVESCEVETLRVISVMPDKLALCAGKVIHELDGVTVQVKVCQIPGLAEWPAKLLVRVEGTRRGHAGRWKEYTEEQAAANARFYALAHTPGAML